MITHGGCEPVLARGEPGHLQLRRKCSVPTSKQRADLVHDERTAPSSPLTNFGSSASPAVKRP
jgi:hypothetical protein